MTERKTFPRLEIQVANACNLTCESCSHFSNNGHRGVLSVEEAQAWMEAWRDRLLPRRFVVLGGEPTINPHLTEILHIARATWPDAELQLTTNGFFLHWHPNLGAALEKLRVFVAWTIHDDSPDYQAKVQEIEALWAGWLAKHDFRLNVVDSARRWTRRYQGWGPNVLPFADGNPAASWSNCWARECRQLFRGLLWKCSPIAYLQLQKQAHPEISPAWNDYLAYAPLKPDCSEQELNAFFDRKAEEICNMSPARPQRFKKASPLISVSELMGQIAQVEAP